MRIVNKNLQSKPAVKKTVEEKQLEVEKASFRRKPGIKQIKNEIKPEEKKQSVNPVEVQKEEKISLFDEILQEQVISEE